MAVSVMGGLIFSTLLTLIFIPVVYELVDRKAYQADQQPLTTPREGGLDEGWQPVTGE